MAQHSSPRHSGSFAHQTAQPSLRHAPIAQKQPITGLQSVLSGLKPMGRVQFSAHSSYVIILCILILWLNTVL